MNDLDDLIEVYKTYLELVKVTVGIQEPCTEDYLNKVKKFDDAQKKETDSGTRLYVLQGILEDRKSIKKVLSNPETIQTFREYAKGCITKACYPKDLIKEFEGEISKKREWRDPFFVGAQVNETNSVVYSFTNVARGLK